MRRRESWLPDFIKGKLLVEARKKIMHLDYIKKNKRYLEFFSYSIKVICVCVCVRERILISFTFTQLLQVVYVCVRET